MAAAKLLRRAAAAAAAVVLLGTFQGPSDPSNLVGFSGMNFSYILAVEAGNSRGSDGQKERSGLGKGNGKGSKGGNEPERRNSDPMLQMNGDDDHAEKEGSSAKKRPAKRGGVKGQSNLRGSASNASGDKSLTSENPVLESIFSAFTEFGKDPDHPLADQVKEVRALNELIDRIFVPRLQTPPKYTGALECVNMSIYRDVLSGPKKVKDNPTLLQLAYSVIRRSPMGLEVPALFVELRVETDKRVWEERRRKEIRLYELRGEPIPERLQLSADEVVALDAEEPQDREEDLSETELAARTIMIDGWMKEQMRLRLYYQKRVGTLDGDPQDLVEAFDAGPEITVSVEEVVGLGYGAVLDPEPDDIQNSLVRRANARAAEF
ncbi:hypothetical protein, conserved [Eimeria acervulina]|uniref:Uncharacterized protein n=1 Tax=Eimeria acervulina TaxID=5801 RepID=U6GQ86_EIMAC|nr:hypothetical protein, conserved [Eimeria acervulina]CDI80764.1 hypothetical protein, conserved [Eimeria acervulina]